jgi:hypothetical protein
MALSPPSNVSPTIRFNRPCTVDQMVHEFKERPGFIQMVEYVHISDMENIQRLRDILYQKRVYIYKLITSDPLVGEWFPKWSPVREATYFEGLRTDTVSDLKMDEKDMDAVYLFPLLSKLVVRGTVRANKEIYVSELVCDGVEDLSFFACLRKLEVSTIDLTRVELPSTLTRFVSHAVKYNDQVLDSVSKMSLSSLEGNLVEPISKHIPSSLTLELDWKFGRNNKIRNKSLFSYHYFNYMYNNYI